MPDGLWRATLTRVRGEFDEMRCLRITPESARVLFGLPEPANNWILERLAAEGFLSRTDQGEYVRRSQTP
jgi:hypothetical protein